MKEIEIENSILKAVSEELRVWLKEKDSITSAAEYEQRILEIGQRITRTLMVETMGEIPKSRNQKKSTYLLRYR